MIASEVGQECARFQSMGGMPQVIDGFNWTSRVLGVQFNSPSNAGFIDWDELTVYINLNNPYCWLGGRGSNFMVKHKAV